MLIGYSFLCTGEEIYGDFEDLETGEMHEGEGDGDDQSMDEGILPDIGIWFRERFTNEPLRFSLQRYLL